MGEDQALLDSAVEHYDPFVNLGAFNRHARSVESPPVHQVATRSSAACQLAPPHRSGSPNHLYGHPVPA